MFRSILYRISSILFNFISRSVLYLDIFRFFIISQNQRNSIKTFLSLHIFCFNPGTFIKDHPILLSQIPSVHLSGRTRPRKLNFIRNIGRVHHIHIVILHSGILIVKIGPIIQLIQ